MPYYYVDFYKIVIFYSALILILYGMSSYFAPLCLTAL